MQLLFICCQHFTGSQQHCRMAIVPAGMHNAAVLRAEAAVVFFLYRQRVDIGAQHYRASGLLSADNADAAGNIVKNLHFNAEGFQFVYNMFRCFIFFSAKFRMGMQPAALL